MIRLGFHLSIAGAIANSAMEANEMKYGAFQLFTTSARSWKNSTIDASDSINFIKMNKSSKSIPYSHMPYLCNLACYEDETYEKSKHMLKDNINNCNMLNIDYLIIHLGSHKGKGIEYGIERVSNALNEVLGSTENVNILLENGSGYNNSVGSKFEEIGAIVDNLQSKRIGVCFDTCHAFAAGYDLRTEEAVDKTINEFDSFVSLSRLRLVHLNDAKYELGSGLDRHWNIGKGYIGRKGFLSLFKNRSFHDGSFVMETPVKEPDDHEKDMKTIKSIINDAIE